MSALQWVIGWASTLQTFALFAILIHRRHHRRLPVFTLYAGAVAVTGTMTGLAYAMRVHMWEAWMMQQVVVAAFRFGIALELMNAIFGAFPAAALTARRVMFATLVATALTAMSVSGPVVTYTQFNAEIVPRLATGAVWILTGLAGLVLWYRLPLGELQRAILLAYAPYLLVFTVAMNLLSSIGWHIRSWVGYVDTLTFFALVNYWCRVAWRTAPDAARAYAPPAVPVPRPAS
jgi:hypothetical protein